MRHIVRTVRPTRSARLASRLAHTARTASRLVGSPIDLDAVTAQLLADTDARMGR